MGEILYHLVYPVSQQIQFPLQHFDFKVLGCKVKGNIWNLVQDLGFRFGVAVLKKADVIYIFLFLMRVFLGPQGCVKQ